MLRIYVHTPPALSKRHTVAVDSSFCFVSSSSVSRMYLLRLVVPQGETAPCHPLPQSSPPLQRALKTSRLYMAVPNHTVQLLFQFNSFYFIALNVFHFMLSKNVVHVLCIKRKPYLDPLPKVNSLLEIEINKM